MAHYTLIQILKNLNHIGMECSEIDSEGDTEELEN